jgi:type II secretory pathway component PulJ
VLLAIQTALFGALRLQNTAHARLDSDLALQRALAIVRRDFSGLMLPPASTATGATTTTTTLVRHLQTDAFSSSTDTSLGERIGPDLFTNSGKIDGWSQFSEVQRVAYYLAPAKEGGDTKDLVRVVQRNLLPVQETTGDPLVLLTGVQEAAVEFYDGTDWTDTWDSEATTSMPRAAKFRVLLAPPDRSQMAAAPIEIIVPIFVTTTQTAAEEAAAAATP